MADVVALSSMADVVALSSMADALSQTLHLSVVDSLQVSNSVIFSIDAVAPPPVRSCSHRTSARRTLLKRRRRTRRRSSSDGEDDSGFFGGDDGGFYGGFGGGRGWNFDGSGGGGGFNWNDWSSSYPEDPAFDFVYDVICWIVFSNCLHFAFKKVVRLITEEREKVPLRIAAVC
ncbi:uncharacterized protein LOC130817722 [Amaranthus tricolor]|uniref:uncharacterized protein LOC130817722 n=1 Tax=Amaranthus tricolor TaxID=29722 RepID=UPI00258D13D5|nr:uncharacterized protein LOC130817722 [Amaranthus tricolor]